jgi:hypothetical protein
MLQRLSALRTVDEDARAASRIAEDATCPLKGEKGLYRICEIARLAYSGESCFGKPGRIAVSTIAHEHSKSFKKYVLDVPQKKELFYKFMHIMGYRTPEKPLVRALYDPALFDSSTVPQVDLSQLSEHPCNGSAPCLGVYKEVATGLVYTSDADKRAKAFNMNKAPTVKDWMSLWNQFTKYTFGDIAIKLEKPDRPFHRHKDTRLKDERTRLHFEHKLDAGLLSLVEANLRDPYTCVAAQQPPSEKQASEFMTAKLKEARAAAANTKTAKTEPKERVLPGLRLTGQVDSPSYERLLKKFVKPMRSSHGSPSR